ncbi:extensin family protein [Sphingomonas mesophila]|uniref:extensin-like domain-containing protein n=1 Tax=Sphingomonas mesophila TaxID=2303576 RepID=UPI000E58AA3A|nr:extensin family protein [Sphingomonas mesophila]
MRNRRGWGCLALTVLLALAGWLGWREFQAYVRAHPEQFPWTPLSLADPVGPFTAQKLAALSNDPAQCRALLAAVDDLDRPAPARAAAIPECGYSDGMTIVAEPGTPSLAPAGLVTACPVAAALHLWLPAVQQAARDHLGTSVTRIDHFGSYSCRRLYGASSGPWSEHATADALDIAGFRLADGRRITAVGDWSADGPEAAFLRAARDEACRLFATVLSPDYNAAHRDHFHLDQAARGARGGSMCR